ncbi:2-hydroxyacyl-CoA dehydratase family protein [Methylomonas fluvii]|uniref:2-hydroxyacyl-CoA dehydratase n=1 Tax=Methylomonas fluvii TaxID=1854564 RepID=A0ABR9D9Z8_9GAMM|nr:2-hydroxyacyl-CoA dehydratase family protein [Methylomonas fluvii]MBD9359908.1 2-hydroxyacyl-CoA dehydratase [Methylomonas fluvii]
MTHSDSQPGSKYSVETANGPIGQRVAALQREAGKCKGAELPAAVACLQEAAELMRQHPSSYSLSQWLSLPLVLQQVGRFEEAIEEFHRLLDEVEERVKNEAPRQIPTIRQKFVHLNYFQIYDQMSLACKRQELVNQAQQYALLASQHYQVFLDLSVESYYYKSTHERPDVTDN